MSCSLIAWKLSINILMLTTTGAPEILAFIFAFKQVHAGRCKLISTLLDIEEKRSHMVKLYRSTQHSAVQLPQARYNNRKCQQSTILNDITWRLPSQTNDVRMPAPSVRMSNIVGREVDTL